MRCVSLFSGCGGLDLGLTRAGFTVVLAVDNDPVCAASYRAAFPQTAFYEGSVADLASLAQLSRASRGATRRPIDLLAGVPPCPPFSKSRFYRTDKPRSLGDKLAETTLNGYLTVLRLLEPRAFLLENVPGLAYSVHRDALDHVLSVAENDLGYRCTWRIVNAADYGVPQVRERFILVGLRGATLELPSPTHAKAPAPDASGDIPRPWVTAGQAIGHIDTDANADDAGHRASGHHHDLLVQLPQGENYLYFTARRGHPEPRFKWRSRYWSFLLKLSRDRPSWTIQAKRSNNMGPFHWRNRMLRLAEIKALQTFPENWPLAGSIDQQWHQIGNAVPPLLAQRLGEALFAQLAQPAPSAGPLVPAAQSPSALSSASRPSV